MRSNGAERKLQSGRYADPCRSVSVRLERGIEEKKRLESASVCDASIEATGHECGKDQSQRDQPESLRRSGM